MDLCLSPTDGFRCAGHVQFRLSGVPPDPLMGIHAAVTQRLDGTPEGGWYPDSRVMVAEALKAYTLTPASVHNANDLGTIAPDKRADLVVLSNNILAIPPSELPDTRVDMTLFDGRSFIDGFEDR